MSNNVKFTKSGTQEKIIKYAKKHEEKNQSAEIDPEMTLMKELVDKDIKTAIINILHMFKKVNKRILSKLSIILDIVDIVITLKVC